MYSREDIVYTYGGYHFAAIYVTYLEMNDTSIYIKEILGKFPKMQTNISAFFLSHRLQFRIHKQVSQSSRIHGPIYHGRAGWRGVRGRGVS